MTVIITVPSTVFLKATELTVWDVPSPPRVMATVKMDKGVARSWFHKILCINYSIIMV